ncbi:sensor histidine kinase [Halobaculum litoreum]|uniref:histidine kinase n=1 Tax=Halobaculum litoreum TaxID=3031998 RepID=A0ABD5XW07_9EURY
MWTRRASSSRTGTGSDKLVENLVRNATEHSDDGVVVRVVDTPDGFAVTDDGPGIPPEDREAVFDAGYSTNADGTGLGLSIVADIAEAHGWDLTVTECERGGARFEVADADRPDDHGADGTDGTVC